MQPRASLRLPPWRCCLVAAGTAIFAFPLHVCVCVGHDIHCNTTIYCFSFDVCSTFCAPKALVAVVNLYVYSSVFCAFLPHHLTSFWIIGFASNIISFVHRFSSFCCVVSSSHLLTHQLAQNTDSLVHWCA